MSAHDHGPCMTRGRLLLVLRSDVSVASPLARAGAPRKSTTKSGRGGGSRTPSLRFWRPTLYQLSYTPRAWPTARERLHSLVRQACHIFFLTSCRLWRQAPEKPLGSRFFCVFLWVYSPASSTW